MVHVNSIIWPNNCLYRLLFTVHVERVYLRMWCLCFIFPSAWVNLQSMLFLSSTCFKCPAYVYTLFQVCLELPAHIYCFLHILIADTHMLSIHSGFPVYTCYVCLPYVLTLSPYMLLHAFMAISYMIQIQTICDTDSCQGCSRLSVWITIAYAMLIHEYTVVISSALINKHLLERRS